MTVRYPEISRVNGHSRSTAGSPAAHPPAGPNQDRGKGPVPVA